MASPSRPMTKSPLAVARVALSTARRVLPDYASRYSRHDFTQAQIFAILVLKAFFRMGYRDITDLLRDFSDLREVLELEKVPHYSTLCHAERRLLKKGLLEYSSVPSFDALESLDSSEDAP